MENRTTAWGFDGIPNQRWKVTPNADGTYSIRPADNLDLGLEVYYGADANQQPITQYIYDTSINYKWRIISNNDGTYRIMPAISNTKGLDVHNGTDTTMTFNGRSFPKRDGIDVQLYDYTGGSHRKWEFESVISEVEHVSHAEDVFYWTFLDEDAPLAPIARAKPVEQNIRIFSTVDRGNNTRKINKVRWGSILYVSNQIEIDWVHGLDYEFNNGTIYIDDILHNQVDCSCDGHIIANLDDKYICNDVWPNQYVASSCEVKTTCIAMFTDDLINPYRSFTVTTSIVY